MVDFAFFSQKRKNAEKSSSSNTNNTTKAASFSIKSLPSELQLVFCAGGIFVCYLTYGILQEKIYKFKHADGVGFKATFFLLFLQCLVNVVYALVCMQFSPKSNYKVPVTDFCLSGGCYIFAMLFSNEALKYVSYPTQALGKSSKMVPVMLFGVLFGSKKYKAFEYICVLLVTAGITMFQLFGSKSKKASADDSMYGIVLLCVSLAMDGVTGVAQDRIKVNGKEQKCEPKWYESMLYTNAVAVVITFVLAVAFNQIVPSIEFCLKNPDFVTILMGLSITSSLGQNFIFLTVTCFDTLVLTTITTTRKFFTILLSVVIYGHSLNIKQWLSVGVTFLGISGEVYDKYEKKQAAKKAKEAAKQE